MRGPSLAVLLVVLVACDGHDGAQADGRPQAAEGHTHDPQHGGVLVALGDEYAHVELAVEPETGRVRAWLYDREVRPVRSAASALVWHLDDGRTIELDAVASALTGETVGDTSCFEADVPELAGAREVTGRLSSIAVLGREFDGVPVHWTAGE